MNAKLAYSFSAAFSAYLSSQHARAVAIWERPPEWTRLASEACRAACQKTFGEQLRFASRSHDDGLQCEYLSIDCTLHDDTWGLPKAMIELENSPRQLSYSAWKLLCTRVPNRILVGYYVDAAKAEAQIVEVTNMHSDEPLLVLLAPWDAPPRSRAAWRTFWRQALFTGSTVTRLGT